MKGWEGKGGRGKEREKRGREGGEGERGKLEQCRRLAKAGPAYISSFHTDWSFCLTKICTSFVRVTSSNLTGRSYGLQRLYLM